MYNENSSKNNRFASDEEDEVRLAEEERLRNEEERLRAEEKKRL